jgi:hypothetical protein
MSSAITDNLNAVLDDWLNQLQIIEQQSPHSTLAIYVPGEAHAGFYHSLCRYYLAAPELQRARIRSAVSDKDGVLNCFLGYMYESARHIRETKSNDWLQLGLAAASIRGDGPDYRDFLLALTELYVAAEAAGLDAKSEFAAIGGGVPANFDTYAVLKARHADIKRGKRKV